jgi:uncharacterized membrane protein
MQSVAQRVVGAANAWFGAFGVLALSSFGIYLGRFQRWNSWSVFTSPGRFAHNVWPHLTQPHEHPRTLAVTLLFTVFLAATYLVFYSFARPSMFEARERRQ